MTCRFSGPGERSATLTKPQNRVFDWSSAHRLSPVERHEAYAPSMHINSRKPFDALRLLRAFAAVLAENGLP